jgi:uncharacterized protein (DUF2132 family)
MILSSLIMDNKNKNNPLHGITLERVVTELVAYFGWDELGRQIRINCFNYDASIKSSLKFLRRTPWAREKVELFYLDSQDEMNQTSE